MERELQKLSVRLRSEVSTVTAHCPGGAQILGLERGIGLERSEQTALKGLTLPLPQETCHHQPPKPYDDLKWPLVQVPAGTPLPVFIQPERKIQSWGAWGQGWRRRQRPSFHPGLQLSQQEKGLPPSGRAQQGRKGGTFAGLWGHHALTTGSQPGNGKASRPWTPAPAPARLRGWPGDAHLAAGLAAHLSPARGGPGLAPEGPIAGAWGGGKAVNQNGDFFWRRRRRQGRGAGAGRGARGAARGGGGGGRGSGRRAGALARPPDLRAGSGSGARPARGLRGVWAGRGRALTCGAQRDGGGAGAGAGRAGGQGAGAGRAARAARAAHMRAPAPPTFDSWGAGLSRYPARAGRGGGRGRTARGAGGCRVRPSVRRASSAKWPVRLPKGRKTFFQTVG